MIDSNLMSHYLLMERCEGYAESENLHLCLSSDFLFVPKVTPLN